MGSRSKKRSAQATTRGRVRVPVAKRIKAVKFSEALESLFNDSAKKRVAKKKEKAALAVPGAGVSL